MLLGQASWLHVASLLSHKCIVIVCVCESVCKLATCSQLACFKWRGGLEGGVNVYMHATWNARDNKSSIVKTIHVLYNDYICKAVGLTDSTEFV